MTTASEPAPSADAHRAERGTPAWTQSRLEEMVLDLIAKGTNTTRSVLQAVIRRTDPKIDALILANLKRPTIGTRSHGKLPKLEKAERRWAKRLGQILRKHVMFGRIRAVGKDQWEIA